MIRTNNKDTDMTLDCITGYNCFHDTKNNYYGCVNCITLDAIAGNMNYSQLESVYPGYIIGMIQDNLETIETIDSDRL